MNLENKTIYLKEETLEKEGFGYVIKLQHTTFIVDNFTLSQIQDKYTEYPTSVITW